MSTTFHGGRRRLGQADHNSAAHLDGPCRAPAAGVRPPLGAAPPDLSARMANARAAAPPFPEHCALRYPRSGPACREKGAARSHGVAEGSFSKA